MAIELADGVFQLSPLPYLNVVAVRGADGWTLVDAGIPQLAGRLVGQLRGLGIRDGEVERVVLTHGHVDHAGGAARLLAAFGAREVLVGADDADAVQRGTDPPGSLPTPGYPAVPTATAHGSTPIALADDRRLVPVPTPGHTPGHTALHLPDDSVVLGGDTVFNVFRLRPAPGFVCSDEPRNRLSVATVAALAPDTLQLAHGRPVTGDVRGRLEQLLTP